MEVTRYDQLFLSRPVLAILSFEYDDDIVTRCRAKLLVLEQKANEQVIRFEAYKVILRFLRNIYALVCTLGVLFRTFRPIPANYIIQRYIYENLGDSSTIFSSKSEEHARTCFAIEDLGKVGKTGRETGREG